MPDWSLVQGSGARRAARILLALSIGIISWLALMPQASVPLGSGWDKLDHVGAFLVLGLLGQHGFAGGGRWEGEAHRSVFFQDPMLRVSAGLLGYGIGLELAQGFTGRVSSVADVVADTLGLALAHLVYALGQRAARRHNRPAIGREADGGTG